MAEEQIVKETTAIPAVAYNSVAAGIRTSIGVYLFVWGLILIGFSFLVLIAGSMGDGGPAQGLGMIIDGILLLAIFCWVVGIAMMFKARWAKFPAAILLLIASILPFMIITMFPFSIVLSVINVIAAGYLVASRG